jgi:hypothetical protein
MSFRRTNDGSSGADELRNMSKEIEEEIEGGAYVQFYIHVMTGHI